MPSESPIQTVADTAFMVAAYRARETARADALFQDPFAARLAGEEGRRILARLPDKAFLGGWTVIIRTGVIDRLIQEEVAGGVDTVLNLGAGLDARPYRLDLPPALRWIEADYDRIIDMKEARLAGEAPRCRLERVRLDLSDGAARRAFLAESTASARKTLVLTEGVVPYLTEGDAGELAGDLRRLPSAAGWIVDYFSQESYRYRRRSGMAKTMEKAPFRFEPADYFGFFASHGWQPKEIRYLAEEGERQGRPFPLPTLIKLWLRLIRPWVPLERRQAMMRFAGFVLFEPRGSRLPPATRPSL